MKEKDIKKLIDEGHFRVNVIFEVIGHPKAHVDETIKAYIANIKTEVTVTKEDYEPIEEIEDNMFSGIVETEMILKGVEQLTWLCLNFAPASIEILEPDSLTLTQRDANHWLNDLLSKIHEIGTIQKQFSSQNQGLVRNFNAMTRNAIILTLRDPANIAAIAKKIGMLEEHTEQFLNALIKEKKIREDKGIYYLSN